MREMLETAARLLFPPRCAVCTGALAIAEWEDGLCGGCKESLPFLPAGECPRCGGRSETGGLCGDCLRAFAFASACAAFPYGAVRDAIHLFKYRGGKAFGSGLGRLMAAYLAERHGVLLAGTDALVPVPLHPKKEARRGFNQAALLCRAVSEETGLPLREDILRRERETAAQSLLSVGERKENLRGAFKAGAEAAGKRLLLVDDIFTTGTTCNECAKALYRAGAAEVSVFCLSLA